ncbi:MAG: sigma factor-like helix-turn-helix DNA-binding protein [Ktedonobacterales bacterium]
MDDSKKLDTQGRERRHAGSVAAAPPDGNAAPQSGRHVATAAPVLPDATIEPELEDPRVAADLARLKQRTPTGAYTIPETSLVRIIRGWRARGETAVVRTLCGILIERCMPEFQRRAWGLRHRPDLMEDAIEGMIEQVLREAQDPSEIFMTQNFIHYLRCCAADNFGRVLRQEGLSYRRDEQGRPVGRPLHVPRALVDRIDVSAEDREEEAGAAPIIADPRDGLEERMAAVEAQRILGYLPDPLDRQIMILRALEHMRWDDIAKLCGKTERTMRLRYEKALVRLRKSIEAEPAAIAY